MTGIGEIGALQFIARTARRARRPAVSEPGPRALPDRDGASSRQGRILSRTYTLMAAASFLPLLMLVVVLAVLQFSAQREQLLADLQTDATGHNVLLSGIIESVDDYVALLGTWAELYGAGEAPPAPAAPGDRLWTAADARLLLRGEVLPARAGAQAEIALADGLAPHMRLAHRTMPYVRWSYYFSGRRDFLTVYPLAAGQPLGGRLGLAPPEQVVDIMFGHDIVQGGGPEGMARHGHWTRPYLDPGGAGWVVGRARPVYRDGQVSGVVGAAVLVDFLTGFLRAFDYPAGRLWLVNQDLQVLAANDGGVVADLELVQLRDVLPASLREVPASELLRPARGFRNLNGEYLLTQQVGAAPWRLLLVVGPDELTRVMLPRFVPYGLILAGLILTALLAQQFRQRLIIRPALAFVEFVRAESQDRPGVPRPRLPAVWQPWLDAVAEAFEARRASLRQIRDSAEHFRTIAESHPVPVAIVSLEERRILHASRSFAELFGVPLDEIRGGDPERLWAEPEERGRLLERLRRDGSVRGEFLARRADGSLFPALLTSRLIGYQGRTAIVSAVHDLTDQKRAEAEIARQREALRQSEKRFRTIAEAHPVPMCIVRRADRRIVYANQRFTELIGLTSDELCRMHSYDLYPDAADRDRWSEALRHERRCQDVETTARRADGTLFPVALSAQVIEYEGQEAGVFSLIDLSEKKRAEEEIARQREALHQSEKLNALGSMLANVAHELNNPLSVVVGYATMMRDLAPDEPTRERAVRIHAAAERCARVVRTFLAMARRKPASRSPVRLNQVVEAALEVAGYGLRTTDVTLAVDLAPDLPEVLGDPDQLTLVLMNLIVNAQHALQEVGPPRRLEITTARAGAALRLEVRDNGPGVPPALAERIFEPFFTTKPQGVGTGIGLSVCRNVLHAHGGEIALGTPEGGGCCFTITLPLAPVVEESGPEEGARPAGDVLSGRILIVEDEVEIAEVLAEMLSRDGHEILLAESGREALARLEKERVDLIISDLHMPDLGGPELYRALVERWPGWAERMVFMTGDVLGADVTGFLSSARVPVFDKPIDPYDIRIKVRAQLAARQPAPVA